MAQVYTQEILNKTGAVRIITSSYKSLTERLDRESTNNGSIPRKGVWNSLEKEMRYPLEQGDVSLLDIGRGRKFVIFTTDVPDNVRAKVMKGVRKSQARD